MPERPPCRSFSQDCSREILSRRSRGSNRVDAEDTSLFMAESKGSEEGQHEAWCPLGHQSKFNLVWCKLPTTIGRTEEHAASSHLNFTGQEIAAEHVSPRGSIWWIPKEQREEPCLPGFFSLTKCTSSSNLSWVLPHFLLGSFNLPASVNGSSILGKEAKWPLRRRRRGEPLRECGEA